MAAFTPGDPWPPPFGSSTPTPGGVVRAEWGGYLKLWVLAEIAPGNVWTLGPDPDGHDRLDAGNVLGDGGTMGAPSLPVDDGLWIDLTCDVVGLELRGGAPTAQGVLSRCEAATLEVTLYDRTGQYDPLNPDTPFALGGRSRLIAGVRVKMFVEIVHDPATSTVFRYELFNGTADGWAEEWTKDTGSRRAKLVASDLVKKLANMERGAQPPVGAGDTPFDRVNRIAVYFGVNPPSGLGTLTSRTLSATTLEGTAWEQLNRAVTDDLGFLYVSGAGYLVYQSSLAWQYLGTGPPVDLTIGCDDPGVLDIVTDARPAALDAWQINRVVAARQGGVEQDVQNATSVAQYGEHSHKKTDLGLADDAQVSGWAVNLVALSAFPRHAVDQIVLEPAVADNSWYAFERVFTIPPVSSLIRLLLRTPAFDYGIDVNARLVGWTHTVTPWRWSTEWRTVAANMGSGAPAWTMGPDAHDRLDAGNVLV